MEINYALLNLLERALGKSEKRNKGNYAFNCPNCNHVKKKLEVNVELRFFECWVCGKRDNFKGRTISQLLRKIKAPQEYLDELKIILPNENIGTHNTTQTLRASLPKEFKQLHELAPNNKIEAIKLKQARTFLRKRRITDDDILKFNLGVCLEGDYADRVIVPSYDKNGMLNYFVARDFTNNLMQKYKNPEATVKDIIGFELYINWDAPVIIVEGAFDALTIKRNVIPLFGKVIHETLLKKLVESRVKKIYIALDSDANKDAIQYCEQLMAYGKEIYLVELDGKDANEIGFERFLDIIENTMPLDFQSLLMKKLTKI